jgi:NitT/TauT family transport system substrate-binding protein
MWLVTRNPNVKTLADLGPADKIALPTVKISSQAILLQMAARKAFGDAGFDKLDAYTTTLGHPEAAAALSNLGGAVNAHFSAPPFQQAEAKLSGARVLTTSTEILGGPVSNAVHYGTVKFHDANPVVVKAFLAAVEEANKFIAEHPREACEIYVAATGEKAPVDDLVKLIQEPGMIYSSTPYGMMKFATHMSDVKVLRMRAEKWQDFFFPEVHALKGD